MPKPPVSALNAEEAQLTSASNTVTSPALLAIELASDRALFSRDRDAVDAAERHDHRGVDGDAAEHVGHARSGCSATASALVAANVQIVAAACSSR